MSKHHRKQGSRDAARPETKVNVFEEVGALIKERRKYADWLTALEAKRDQTPESVYAKVHLDYETRLKAVVDELGEHRETLTQEQDALQKKLAELDAQIEEHQEERAETEIRAQVGELSAAALTEALRVVDTELERLEDKRATVETDLSRIEDFFAAADGTVSRPARTSSPKRRGGFDEMSFLNSVVGQPKPEAPEKSEVPPVRTGEIKAQRAPEPKVEAKPEPKPEPKVEPLPQPSPPPKPVEVPPPAPVQPPAPPSMVAEKAAAPEATQADGVVEKATELEVPPPQRPIPRQSIAMTMAALTLEGGARAQSDLGIIKTGDELPPSILDGLTPGSGGAKPLAANVASNNPLSLKGSATPNDLKSLKCKECGTMNDPSEWYCERCGAELSAI